MWVTCHLDRIILSFRKPFLSFYIYLLLIWLFMFIFIFLCCFLTTERVYCKIREIATFLEALEFRSIFTCICPQTPMSRGTTFLHIHRGPPYTFAQNTPLNPIFMGHRFNLCWHLLLSHSQTISTNQIASCFQSVRETTLVMWSSKWSKMATANCSLCDQKFNYQAKRKRFVRAEIKSCCQV